MLKRRMSFNLIAALKGMRCAKVVGCSNFHGASGLDLVFVVIAVAADTAQVIALV